MRVSQFSFFSQYQSYHNSQSEMTVNILKSHMCTADQEIGI